MTDLSTLERKRLSDLHQIASQLGIEQYRKYRKPELAQRIYEVATEQASTQNVRQDPRPSEPAATNGASSPAGEVPDGARSTSQGNSQNGANGVVETANGEGNGVAVAPEAPEQRRPENRERGAAAVKTVARTVVRAASGSRAARRTGLRIATARTRARSRRRAAYSTYCPTGSVS